MGGCAAFWGGSWVPSSTMWPGPRPTSTPSDILIHPAVWPQYGHRPKIGGSAPLSGAGGTGSLLNTVSLGPRPTSLSSGWHLDPYIHLATTDMGRKLWQGCAPLGRGAGSPSNTMWPRHAKYLLDPSNRLATIHQRHRQTEQDRHTDRQ